MLPRLQRLTSEVAGLAAAMSLDGLPLEVLDTIVRCLAAEVQPGGSRKRLVPPRGLGCLAAVSRRLRLCCVERADGIWQAHEQAAFGVWPQHRSPADNATAHARYSEHMSTRVRLRRAVWARTKPAGLGRIPTRLPVNPGCSDSEIQFVCRCVRRPPPPPPPRLVSSDKTDHSSCQTDASVPCSRRMRPTLG